MTEVSKKRETDDMTVKQMFGALWNLELKTLGLVLLSALVLAAGITLYVVYGHKP